MADSHRAAIDVNKLGVNAKDIDGRKCHGGEGFIYLPEGDLLLRELGFLQGCLGGHRRHDIDELRGGGCLAGGDDAG